MASPEGGPRKRRRERAGLRKSRLSSAAAEEEEEQGNVADLESLERVQLLQATRKKTKGITSADSALGKAFHDRLGGGESGDGGGPGEDAGAGAGSEPEPERYGLQKFATENQDTRADKSNEEERMKRYIEERLGSGKREAGGSGAPGSGKPGGLGGRGDGDLDEILVGLSKRSKGGKASNPTPTYEDPGAIAEVPVSMEDKLRNIERVERAKRDLVTGGRASLLEDEKEGQHRAKRSDFPTNFGS